MAKEKTDPGYGDSPGGDGGKSHADLNELKGHDTKSRQRPGGETDNTPGQVGLHDVGAIVHLTATEGGAKGLDSMGGAENRGKGNYRENSNSSAGA